ncbi:CDP-alcohol phosphatidyltransferase family protein [Streptomyces sp. MJP52]|uniref:CDP-alcohol phosphatidyltransferase family protein n=1 Tax=Streptomyces sp. MJP52 TaxID=2940555 RepID=UPI002473D0BC|nr:CDP-alcohol phosphatidyltransferase family protein [Streptomyces sp. MJP52]MDH6226827.1 phosphatidylglycerophosphate synthase [Streptomyces sp. MJP52]
MSQLSLRAVQRITCKKRDAWWTVFLVDPLATRLLMVLARFRFVTPNGVTWAALVFGLVSAGFFLAADPVSLVIGAVLYHFSFVLDCVDGKLARLKNNGSLFGGWLDYVFDRVRVLFCAVGLMGGQYLRTGEGVFLLAGLVIVFLDSLRYLDALQIYKMRAGMRGRIKKAVRARRAAERAAALEAGVVTTPASGDEAVAVAEGEAGSEAAVDAGVVFMEDLLRDSETEGEGDGDDDRSEEARAAARVPDRKVIDLHTEFRTKFPWYTRVRTALLNRRVRPHLVSGIEFQMFVFIVGPLIGQLLWTTAVAAALMLAFELVIMYKFWLSTKDFNRVMAELSPAPANTVGVIVPQAFKGYVAPEPEPAPVTALGGEADAVPFMPAQSQSRAEAAGVPAAAVKS